MDPLSCSLQLLVVLTPSWETVEGNLVRYERISSSHPWEMVGDAIPIVVGKNGMAWGRGLHEEIHLKGERKREGDLKAPAGIFSLGTAFGDASHLHYARKIPYLMLQEGLEGVDDSHSRYYNQLVLRSSIQNPDWKSAENMLETASLYAIGMVIEHNSHPPIPLMGSCIFMHIWRQRGEGTAGCTAMEEASLNALLFWLDAQKHPRLVQLPVEEYALRQREWDLPALLGKF